MKNTEKEKFASQADPELLSAVRAIAEAEGRQFQAVLDEALRDLVEKKRNGKARPHVLSSFEKTAKNRDWLYQQLAK
jgi:hypothetical protein